MIQGSMVGGFLNGRLDCLTCQTSTVCTFRCVWINYFRKDWQRIGNLTENLIEKYREEREVMSEV